MGAFSCPAVGGLADRTYFRSVLLGLVQLFFNPQLFKLGTKAKGFKVYSNKRTFIINRFHFSEYMKKRPKVREILSLNPLRREYSNMCSWTVKSGYK